MLAKVCSFTDIAAYISSITLFSFTPTILIHPSNPERVAGNPEIPPNPDFSDKTPVHLNPELLITSEAAVTARLPFTMGRF